MTSGNDSTNSQTETTKRTEPATITITAAKTRKEKGTTTSSLRRIVTKHKSLCEGSSGKRKFVTKGPCKAIKLEAEAALDALEGSKSNRRPSVTTFLPSNEDAVPVEWQKEVVPIVNTSRTESTSYNEPYVDVCLLPIPEKGVALFAMTNYKCYEIRGANLRAIMPAIFSDQHRRRHKLGEQILPSFHMDWSH